MSLFESMIKTKQNELTDINAVLEQYKNLRKHFTKMYEEILGEDYYNEGMDVYTCDEFICRDIIAKANESWFNRLFSGKK